MCQEMYKYYNISRDNNETVSTNGVRNRVRFDNGKTRFKLADEDSLFAFSTKLIH